MMFGYMMTDTEGNTARYAGRNGLTLVLNQLSDGFGYVETIVTLHGFHNAWYEALMQEAKRNPIFALELLIELELGGL